MAGVQAALCRRVKTQGCSPEQGVEGGSGWGKGVGSG